MTMFNFKKAEQTIHDRLAASVATREAALSVFHAAHADLANAEADAHAVAADVSEQMKALAAIHAAALDEASVTASARAALGKLLGK